MLDDLTKTFFDTFEIEPKLDCKRCGAKNFALGQCAEVSCKKTYPQITPDILLELICILSKYQKDVGSLLEICETDKNSIKEEILDMLIFRDTALKQQVQSLFKEG